MHEIIDRMRSENLSLHESRISADDDNVRKFRELFESVRKVRAGHTAVMTLQTLDTPTPEKDIVTEYRFRSQIGKRIWLTPFEVCLPSQYFGKTYLLDGKGLAQARRQTAFAYENPLEQYVRLKQISPGWKTEMDLFYLWSGDNFTAEQDSGYCMLLLAPSTRIPISTREQIITEGVAHLGQGRCDAALILSSDNRYVQDSVNVLEAKMFSLVYAKDDVKLDIETAAAKVKAYQENNLKI